MRVATSACFRGSLSDWEAPGDAAALRESLPADRLRVYDSRAVVAALVDRGSALEMRRGFGAGIVTALARFEERALADAADKATRFLQLCDAHGLPIVSLIDTPDFMVGPDIERRGEVARRARGRRRVAQGLPPGRHGYGGGRLARASGDGRLAERRIRSAGARGRVELGYRKEPESAAPGDERDELRQRLVAEPHEKGKALNLAATFEIDAVIDPGDTRAWLVRVLDAAPVPPASCRFIDPW